MRNPATFSGDVAPALSLAVNGVDSLDLDYEARHLSYSADGDIALGWFPGDDPGACVRVLLNGSTQYMYEHGVPIWDYVWCETLDVGTVVVPHDIIRRLEIDWEYDKYQPGYDHPASRLERYTRDAEATDFGPSELVVLSMIQFYLKDVPAEMFRVSSTGDWVEVACGRHHTCGRRDSGIVECWGGHNVLTPPGYSFVQIDAGDDAACGVKSDGGVACWGSTGASFGGSYQQVGVGSAVCALSQDASVDCDGLDDVASTFDQIAVGAGFACGLRTDQSVHCWGENSHGQVQSQPPEWGQVTAGVHVACSLDLVGEPTCWGRDTFGMLAPPSGPFQAIEVGAYHGCGLRPSGEVDCWGCDWPGFQVGQCGIPAGIYSDLCVGEVHTCAIRSDGHVVCWGENLYEQASPP